MKEKILLSIVIPTYKRSDFLMLAINSAIYQEDKSINYEIIVVNNDPESDIEWIEKSCADSDVPVRIYKNERNLGMLGNMNRCAELANGKYIAYLHDDDFLLPNYLQNIKDILLKNEEIACVIPCRYLYFEKEDNSREYSLEKKRKIKNLIINLNPLRIFTKKRISRIRIEDNVYAWQNCYCAPSCGTIINKEILSRCGGFSGSQYAWDYSTFLEMNKKEKMYILHKPLSVYRMTSGASLRAEVQYDFFVTNESLMGHVDKDSKCGRFISKYLQEIRYLDYSSLTLEAKAYVSERCEELVKEKKSELKYLIFMIKRLFYYSSHHLDVERPLSKKKKDYIINLERGLRLK